MTSLDHRVIQCVVATGRLDVFQRLGVSVDWFQDAAAKAAWVAVQEYAEAQRADVVPSRDYLVERGAVIPGEWQADCTPEQLAEALTVARHKQLNARILHDFATANGSDPERAVREMLEQISTPEYEGLRTRGRETTFKALAPQIYDEYVASSSSGGVLGVETPFPALTYTTKGWQRGNLYCLYAPQKSMKSFVMLLFGLHAWRTRPTENVLFVTSEMPSEELTVRLACMMHGWNFNHWRDRELPRGTVAKILATDLDERWHWYQPSGQGLQALSEVRARISALNMRGGVSLVVWDGHYRSAASEEWEDVYSLVRHTRMMALEHAIQRPAVIISAQEGSQRGKVSHKAYTREASLMMFQEKISSDRLVMRTTAVREGPSLEMDIAVSWSTSSFVEDMPKIEGVSADEGAVKGGW